MKRVLVLLTVLLLLAFPVMAEEGGGQTAVNAAYAAVLLEGAEFVPLGDIRAEWNPVRFTVLDLDGDGLNEVVLEVEAPEAYIILSGCENVYAQEWPYRGMLDLKDDGTFYYASGAADSGIARLIFQGDYEPAWGYLPLAESYTDENGNVQYMLDGGAESTDEAGFNAELAAQEAKLAALWYDYSPEMVRLLLGQ